MQGSQRVEKTGCQSTQATVAQPRLFFHDANAVQVHAHFLDGLNEFVIKAHVEQAIA